MGRSIEQMKTLISDANKKINDIEGQMKVAVDYKVNLIKQLSEVIAESTKAPTDIEKGEVVVQSSDDINSADLIGYSGHGLIDKPTEEDILRNAEKGEDGSLIVVQDPDIIIDVSKSNIMEIAAAEAAAVSEAKAKDIAAGNPGEEVHGTAAAGLNNEETGKPEGEE